MLLIIIRLQQLRLKVTRVLFLLRLDNRLARARQSFSDIVAVVIVNILGRGRGGEMLFDDDSGGRGGE